MKALSFTYRVSLSTTDNTRDSITVSQSVRQMALSRLSRQSRASFFVFSRTIFLDHERAVGSGCCINAATVLAVIDSCRKAAAVEGRAGVRGREGRAI